LEERSNRSCADYRRSRASQSVAGSLFGKDRLKEIDELLEMRNKSQLEVIREDAKMKPVISTLQDEEDEWAALQKFYVLQDNKRFAQEQQDKRTRTHLLAAELSIQQSEFMQRKKAYRDDMRDYA